MIEGTDIIATLLSIPYLQFFCSSIEGESANTVPFLTKEPWDILCPSSVTT